MSALEFLTLATTMIIANALLMVLNLVMVVRNRRIGRQHTEALRQLPRLVRAGEAIDARPGERVAIEFIVPPHPIPPPSQPPPKPTHPPTPALH